MSDQSPISKQLWWVIPNRLAGVRKPTEAELSELKKAGVEALVSLLSDDSNLDLYQKHQIPHIWIPTIGGKAPSLEQIEQVKAFVDTQATLGHAVAVHCSSGRRRTGTGIAALLILEGSCYKQALDTLLTANPDIELREAQLNFLKNLETP